MIVENTGRTTVKSEATVKVHVGGKRIIATAEGNGPVNALDSALRSAVAEQFPEFNQVELVDYKVRILAGSRRHRLDHQGAGVVGPRRAGVDHGRRARERRRGVLAGAGGRAGLRAATAGRRRGGRRIARPAWLSPSERTRAAAVGVHRSTIEIKEHADMRLARIAHPDGVAFVAVDGAEGRGTGPGDRGPPVRRPRPSPGAPGRSPTPGCWRRSCRPRWWRSAATTPTTRPSWATRCRPRRSSSSSRPPR